MKQKNKMVDSMLLGTLGASLLGNILTGKRVKIRSWGQGLMRNGNGTTRVGQDF